MQSRIVSEIAFGRLKARWRRLLKRNEMCVENVPNVITAACVLHNICETHHEHFNEAWMQSSNEEYEQPITTEASRDPPLGPSEMHWFNIINGCTTVYLFI